MSFKNLVIRSQQKQETQIAVSGPRVLDLKNYKDISFHLESYLNGMKDKGPINVNLGMNEGFDEYVMQTCLKLGIPYSIYLSNPGFLDYYWIKNSVTGKDRRNEVKDYINKTKQYYYVCNSVFHVDGEKKTHSNIMRNRKLCQISEHIILGIDRVQNDIQTNQMRVYSLQLGLENFEIMIKDYDEKQEELPF